MARGSLQNDDEADLFGSDDDWGEHDNEVGIDYMLSDQAIENTMGEGRAPIIAMGDSDFRQGNPAPPANKVLQKRFRNVEIDKINRILKVHFEDGTTLTIRP